MRILFLHGFPDNPEVWRYCVEFLEGRAVCRTPELHSLTFEDQIKRVHEMTEEGPAVLVGHDMGGPLAIEYSLLHPSKVRRVILINSMGLESWPLLSSFPHPVEFMDWMRDVFANPRDNHCAPHIDAIQAHN